MSTETTVTPLNVNEELTKAVTAAISVEDIRAAVVAEHDKQTATATASAQADADAAAAKVAADAAAKAAAVASTGFTRTEVIGGRSFTFEADTELELERMVSNALRVAYAIQPTEAARSEVPDPAAEAAAAAAAVKRAEADAVAKVELEQGFRAGTISVSEYIKRSGALKEFLAAEGVSIESLKETVNQNVNQKEIQSWADAAEVFKNSPAGDTWPGGEQNQVILGDIISARPDLLNATDKVAAMATAYNVMKQRGTIFKTEVAATQTDAEKAAATQAIADKAVADKAAADAAALAEQNRKTAASSSSLFSRSSGVATTTVTAPAAGAKVDVPADASPAEIMDAWKKAMVAQGKNPDEAFIDNYRSNRI